MAKKETEPIEGIEYLYELCDDLPRAGPGDNESTRRAFAFMNNLPDHPSILDIGCGPGMQTLELAKISNGTITALDNHQPFLDSLMKKAAKAGLDKRIIPKKQSMFDMDFGGSLFDIVWSEGALYIMGFQNGLRQCSKLLNAKGYLAVTEAVYLKPNPPQPLSAYFKKEYPAMKQDGDCIEMILNEGLHLISHFTLPKSAWLINYYSPMAEKLDKLMAKYRSNSVASKLFDSAREEIELFKKYSDYFGYEFFIMNRDGSAKP